MAHYFVTNRLGHSCSVLVGLPLTLTDRLDRVLRSDVSLIGGVPNTPYFGLYIRETLCWQRIFCRAAELMWHYLHGIAPVYLQELSRPSGGNLLVPCVNKLTMQCVYS